MTSVPDTILRFLQWDLLTGGFAVLVWALTLRVSAQGRGMWAYEWIEGLIKVALLTLLSGPCGAAAAVMWERDELVFEQDRERERMKKIRSE
jgi:hypothetical protein